MAALRLLLKADLRVRFGSLVALAVVVALVVGSVTAGIAGARRTASVLERFREETATSDVYAVGLSRDLAELPEERLAAGSALESVDGVEQVGIAPGFPVILEGDSYFMVYSSPDGSTNEQVDRPHLQEGRLPAADASDEIAVNQTAASTFGLEVGDTVTGPTLTPEDAGAVFEDPDAFAGFNGPELTLDVVGITVEGDELPDRPFATGTDAVASPAFAATYGDSVGAYVTDFGIQVDDTSPDTIRRLTDALAAEVGDYEVGVTTTEEAWADAAEEAYRTLALAIAGFTAVIGAAGLLVLLQAASRQVVLSGADNLVLRGLGLTRGARAVTASVPTLGAAALGSMLGLLGAVLVSDQFPIGVARPAEVDPGIQVDATAMLIGAGIVLVVLIGWVGMTAWRATDPAKRLLRVRRNRLAQQLGRLGARPATTMGVRMAYERAAGGAGVPVRSAVLGAAVAVAAVVALAVIIGSADAVARDPDRYGWTWSTLPDSLADDADAAYAAAAQVEGVAGIADIGFTTVEVDGRPLQAGGVIQVSGAATTFNQLEGRHPQSSTEVALSPQAADDLDVGVGDAIELDDPAGGDPIAFDVVGVVVGPPIDDLPRDVILTEEGLGAVAQSEPSGYGAITYEDDADPAAIEAELEELDFYFTDTARALPPGQVVQIRAIRSLLVGMMALLALLGAAGMLHFLAASIRRRRGDLAVLRALGFVRREIRRLVSWEALSTTAVGLVVGIPAGFIVGRVVWNLAVGDLGIIDTPAMPWGWALLVVAATLVGAVVLAAGPGWYAARQHPMDVLRTE